MASFSSPNETVPLPNSSALSLAVVFVDNSYNEEAMQKNPECAARPPHPFHRQRLPARVVGGALNDADADPGARAGHLGYSWII